MEKIIEKPLLNAALGKKTSRYPIWFLRQAGRYLPEYQEIRAQMSFLELCKDPKKAAEVTIQPLRRFDLDGAIIFSDILIPPTVMGQTLTFEKNHGPLLVPVVRTAEDLKKLRYPQVEKEIGYVADAIRETKKLLPEGKTMIGFAGAPFTVASYMIEGAGSKTYTEVKKVMYRDLTTFKSLLSMLGEITAEYLKTQVDAGADIVMLFDSWAGHLTAKDYRDYVVPVNKKLIEDVKSKTGVPVIYYPGQASDNLAELAGISADVIHIDWRTRISRGIQILKETGLDVTVQGNLDPQTFLGTEETIRARVRDILEQVAASGVKQHIFNVGHGLLPHTSIEGLLCAVDEIRKFKI